MTIAGDPSTARPRRVRPATLAIGLVIVGVAALWVYAWFFAPRGNVDRFADRAWAEGAEQACRATVDDFDRLPSASSFMDIEPKAEALRQRAAVIDEGTALLAAQLAALRSEEAADDNSREGVALWLADWDGYLVSRAAQAEKLRAGRDEAFTVEEQGGAPVTLRMDAFAKTNGMPSCVVPDDIG